MITLNRDDFLRLHRSGGEHNGIVICKDDSDLQRLGQVLHDYLITQETLQNRLLRVLQQNQRGSSHPVFVIREYPRQ